MKRIILAAALAGGATGAAADDGRGVLSEAAEALRLVRSASYEARLEVRGGQSQRVVTGRVVMARIVEFSDPIGGNVAVRGEIRNGDGSSAVETFAAAYDGVKVRRLMDGGRVVLEADPGYGGEELLRGSFGALILGELTADDPFSVDLDAPAVSRLGSQDVAGEACDVIEVREAEAGSTVRWYLGAQDRVPRRRERQFRSAGGNDVESVLTLTALRLNDPVDPAEFRIEAPDGVRVETVGRKPPPQLAVGRIAPDWTMTEGGGRKHTLSEYRGKVVVLDFWSSWCPHCRDAMPTMQRLHDTYTDRGVLLLGVNCRERTPIDAMAFVREKGLTYPVVDGNALAVQYRVGGLPAFYVIGRDGTLVYMHSGYNEQVEAKLEEVIKEAIGH